MLFFNMMECHHKGVTKW